jgi:hypothetical protein
MATGDPDYEARLAADIARLQSAKGIQIGAWLRDNKTFVFVLLAYFAIIGLYAGLAAWRNENPMVGVLLGVFFGPIVLLRIYLRWRRRF